MIPDAMRFKYVNASACVGCDIFCIITFDENIYCGELLRLTLYKVSVGSVE